MAFQAISQPADTSKSRIAANPYLYVFAGLDQEIILPSNKVFLQAEIKADQVQVRGIRWSKLSGPEQYKISNPKQEGTGITNLIEGEYQFLLTVTTTSKIIRSDTVSVNVKRGKDNQPPVADAGPDITIRLPINSVILNGKATDPDPNGFIETYRWTKNSGPSQFQIEADSKPQTRVSNLIAGVYQFGLFVTDNNGGSDQDYVTVTVISQPENEPPVADAGPERTITLPMNRVTLNGRGSDPEGLKVRFRWTKIQGPGQFTIVSPASPQTQVTNLAEGIYQFALTVTDTFGAEALSRVIVSVLPAPYSPVPNPPVADAGDDIAITLPTNSVTLTGIGTHPDSNSRITTYQWSRISGSPQFTLVDPGRSQTQITNLVEGVYAFKFTVIDNKGLTAEDYMSVTVLAPPVTINNPPVVNAGPDQTIQLPTNTVTLSGSATDPDSNDWIWSYQWFKISGPDYTIQTTSDSNRIMQIELHDSGEYVFELKATDDKGAVGQDSVKITIEKPNKSYIWLIVTGLGISTLLASYYFFFWIPTTKKVIVYFMHKDEEVLAKAIMPNSKRTEGYAIDECSRSQIKKMKDKGLAIHVLHPEMLIINTPGKTRTLNYAMEKGQRKLKSENIDSRQDLNIQNLVSEKHEMSMADDFPAFYIITLDMPLLQEFKEKLNEIGITILQHVPYNNYIIFVSKPDQLAAMKTGSFDFIRLINQYSPSDTGLLVREDHYRQAVNDDDHLILDIILHREEDKNEVFGFLEQLGIEVIGTYRSRIRITLPARSVRDKNLAGNKYIQAIYEYIPPQLHNDIARQLIGIETSSPGNLVISETGLGEIIGVADTGIDLEHPDLKSNIIDAVSWGRKENNDTSDAHGHGTHVTGSIVGDGTASGGKIKGMAPGAKVFFQSLLNDKGLLANFDLKLQELFMEAYNHGARIHNNSWGSAAKARYTIDSKIVDDFVFEHPEMLIVISAGNEGICKVGRQGEKGYVGFGSVGSPATTKNGLCVGASRNKRTAGGYASATYGKIWPDKFTDPPTSNELISGDPDSIAAFSSRGRCDDFRMKPDIVAPGTDILSAKSGLAPLNEFHGGYDSYGNAYAFLSGTSMAAPIVSGAAAIVREYYRRKRDLSTPSAALIKATLLNGTRKLKGLSAIYKSDMVPNPNQGFGMLDLAMTIPNDQNMFHLEYRDSLQDPSITLYKNGQEFAVKFRTTQITWIRACLAYTDKPARGIQNNLDLLMDYEPTRDKWSGNIGINADDRFGDMEEDNTNNMEIIRLENAQPGLYTVKVFASNLTTDSQGFALVLTIGDMNVTFE